jgi:hypothetical protein
MSNMSKLTLCALLLAPLMDCEAQEKLITTQSIASSSTGMNMTADEELLDICEHRQRARAQATNEQKNASAAATSRRMVDDSSQLTARLMLRGQ